VVEKAHPDGFDAGKPLIMFHIGNSIGDDLSIVYPNDVDSAAHGWWRFNPGMAGLTYGLVLACNSDRVLGAFRVKRWVPSRDDVGRWGFIGEPAEISVQLECVGKRVPNKLRSQNPVRFVDPGE